MSFGKKLRMSRIINSKTGKTIIVPMDHGATLGPVEGLYNIGSVFNKIKPEINAVIVHKGMIKNLNFSENGPGLIIHLSASSCLSKDPLNKSLVCSVEEAVSLGADGVSVHVNLGCKNEASMLKDLGKISYESTKWGMPLLAMMYAHKNKDMKNSIKTAARIGAELGADIIKCSYTGDENSFKDVIKGCPVPVVIAGGEKTNDFHALKIMENSVKCGACGLSMGRNVFQHPNPDLFLKAAGLIVHENLDSAKAFSYLKNLESQNSGKSNESGCKAFAATA